LAFPNIRFALFPKILMMFGVSRNSFMSGSSHIISEFQFLSPEDEKAFVQLQLRRQTHKRRLDINHDEQPLKRVCFQTSISQDIAGKKVASTRRVKKAERFPDSALPPHIAVKLRSDIVVPVIPEEPKDTPVPKKKCSPEKRKKPRRKSKPRKDKTKYHPLLQVETKRANQVTLLCAHCGVQFSAKATYRERFGHYLVNHACCGRKRTQFVIGRKHKRCEFGCASALGCIRFVLC